MGGGAAQELRCQAPQMPGWPVLSNCYATPEVLGCLADVNSLIVAVTPKPKTHPAEGEANKGDIRSSPLVTASQPEGPQGHHAGCCMQSCSKGMQHCCLTEFMLPRQILPRHQAQAA